MSALNIPEIITAPPRTERSRQVGLVFAFTGHYRSVRIIARFLELAGIEVVTSRISTPEIITTGTTLANSDFCLPLRVFVGHVSHLLSRYPNMHAIITPNIRSEEADSSACAKHRDIGGVALRSLADTVGYLLQQLGPKATREYQQLKRLVNNEALLNRWQQLPRLPQFIMPSVRSLDHLEMRNLCYDIYADIMHWSPAAKAVYFLPPTLWPAGNQRLAWLQHIFTQAYDEVVNHENRRLETLLAQPQRVRLGVVGRNYMVHDPALTCDLSTWFTRQNVAVITPSDVPDHLLDKGSVQGYYDTHKEGQAFIDWAMDKVDGFICLGSFGCHPDAFQIDYLSAYARQKGAACWSFRFDETTGSAGFYTRYETILAFLKLQCDRRIQAAASVQTATVGQGQEEPSPRLSLVENRPQTNERRPLIIWPYMGETLNMAVSELGYQLGVDILPPLPLTGPTLLAGNDSYCESCSPYACSTGSLKESIERVLATADQPRRIIIIMLRGEGPCAFGWYSIAQQALLPKQYGPRLAAGGHTLEMATMGMNGFTDFIRQLNNDNDDRLQPLMDFAIAWENGFDNLNWLSRLSLCARFFLLLGVLARPVYKKLTAAEDLRARSLIHRAHELETGSTGRAYRQALHLLREAHSTRDITKARAKGRTLIANVPHDKQARPRLVVVGEIFVMLTSFANRGTLERLLAQEKVELVEHITVGRFMRSSLSEMRRRAITRVFVPMLMWLRKHNVYILQERLREPDACPFLIHEVGGEGVPTVAGARHHVEKGCDGILHLHPFKCMPEGIAKDALKELAALYNVGYLALSFDKEMDVERLRTEISTYTTLLHAKANAGKQSIRKEAQRRQKIGHIVNRLYGKYQHGKHCN